MWSSDTELKESDTKNEMNETCKDIKSQGDTQSIKNLRGKILDQAEDYGLKNWNNTENSIK